MTGIKKIAFIAWGFFILLSNFETSGQVTDSINMKNELSLNSKEYYLKKSQNKKSAAQILLVSGTALTIGGVFVAASGGDNFFSELFNLLIGAGMIGVGLVADLVSIPFFISSSNYKKKAAALSVKPERVLEPVNGKIQESYIPSVAIKIAF